MGTNGNSVRETLSRFLLGAGFFCAFGTVEDKDPRRLKIGLGPTYAWDRNQGVICVYDELGRPWVALLSKTPDEVLSVLARDYALQRGARVPHSNDGLKFINTLYEMMVRLQ